ncbi:MAG: PhzF family phenazine biosynthesis protein [Candidatus Sulfotelmatobacter sp.]
MNPPNVYRYHVVDVFTQHPLEGNPLAVFPSASSLDDGLMQRIARELNLAETAFVFPATSPDCAVGVRIFTPTKELMFAGHPTVGTAFVLIEEGIVPKNTEYFVLEEKVGPVPIRVELGERPLIWLRTPSIDYGRLYDRNLCAEVLGLNQEDLIDVAPQLVSAGNPTILVPVKDKPTVDRAFIDLHGLRTLKGADHEPVCVFVFTPTSNGAYSRMFAPEYGIPEDPATGSSTGPLASFMMRHGLVSGAPGNRFVSEQGTKMGRRSVLHVHIGGENGIDGIEVGGYVTPVAEATMRLGGRE